MLPLLVSFVLSMKNFTVGDPTKADACFDLKYVADDGEKSMTHDNSGFFVGYIVRNSTSNSTVQLVKHSSGKKSTYYDIEVKFINDFDPVTGYLRIMFNITNNGYFGQKVDLGVYADSDFAGDDNNPVSRRNDGRGLTVTNNQLHYTVFLNDVGSLPNVNTTYIGETSTGAATNYPFFTQTSDESSTLANSAYAFSWLDREVMGGESIILGVTFAPDDKVRTPSKVIDKTKKAQSYFPGQQRTFSFFIEDADVGEMITIHFEFNGAVEEDHFSITAAENSKTFSRKKNIGNGPFFTYKVYATDSEHSWMSNVVEETIAISTGPSILAWNNPAAQNVYKRDGKVDPINLKFEVNDDNNVTIKWRFDNGRVEGPATVYQSNGNYVPVEVNVTIPPQVTFSNRPGDEHTLYLWAEDNFGVKSKERKIKLTCRIVVPIEQLGSGLSKKVVQKGQSYIAYTAINGNEANRPLSVYYKFDDTHEVKVSFTTSKSLIPQAYYIKIPEDLPTGTYDVRVTVKDDEDETASNEKIVLAIVQ